MSKRKNRLEVDVIEHQASPVSDAPPSPEPPESFKRILQSIPHKRNTRGRVSPYNPLYVPNGVKLSFRLAPSPGSLDGVADFQAAKMEGWVPLPPELATTDEDDARANGKVALLAYEVIDGLVRVGPHVAMVILEKEWYDRYYKDLQEIESLLRYKSMGVEVSEQGSHEEEVSIKV